MKILVLFIKPSHRQCQSYYIMKHALWRVHGKVGGGLKLVKYVSRLHINKFCYNNIELQRVVLCQWETPKPITMVELHLSFNNKWRLPRTHVLNCLDQLIVEATPQWQHWSHLTLFLLVEEVLQLHDPTLIWICGVGSAPYRHTYLWVGLD